MKIDEVKLKKTLIDGKTSNIHQLKKLIFLKYYGNMSILPKIIYRFNVIFFKISNTYYGVIISRTA
jgi:hypothetical protein